MSKQNSLKDIMKEAAKLFDVPIGLLDDILLLERSRIYLLEKSRNSVLDTIREMIQEEVRNLENKQN